MKFLLCSDAQYTLNLETPIPADDLFNFGLVLSHLSHPKLN